MSIELGEKSSIFMTQDSLLNTKKGNMKNVLILFSTMFLATFGNYCQAQKTTDKGWKFDFGNGEVAKGYQQVLPEDYYNPSRGFGFLEGAQT